MADKLNKAQKIDDSELDAVAGGVTLDRPGNVGSGGKGDITRRHKGFKGQENKVSDNKLEEGKADNNKGDFNKLQGNKVVRAFEDKLHKS